MELRGIDFGNVLGASGVQGFFGEGYWFHGLGHLVGLNFRGVTFVSKTATLFARRGNMPLGQDHRPRRLFPDCVEVKPLRGLMLNSVGLSNPGLGALLGAVQWQTRTEPFWISIMSVADTPSRRLDELKLMVKMLAYVKAEFLAPFGLQINLSCPNTGHDPKELIKESERVLAVAAALEVPVMLKYSIASAPIPAVMQLNDHPDCDAICVSNSVPFGWEGINWKEVWGSDVSPLAHMGGGALSGKVLCPLVCRWIAELRDAGFTKPINGGGGILRPEDARSYRSAGASSIFLGSVVVLRPWRVQAIIEEVNCLNWR